MAFQISPKHVGALEGLGLLQLDNRHYLEAKQNLKVTINIDTKRWRAYNVSSPNKYPTRQAIIK